LALALTVTLGTIRSAGAQLPPARSRSTLITVADSVQLEVVDWGGEGPTLIFLAGGGHTAHVFDGFVPRLTSRLHVMGITRRGFGASGRPKKGYDSTTLVRDLIAALDSLRPRKPLCGHLRRQRMSILAARFPERVDRLIYLDSGFDYRQRLDRRGRDGARAPSRQRGLQPRNGGG
jgi:pimeloyl-ACP methyl ester carboxylesterase